MKDRQYLLELGHREDAKIERRRKRYDDFLQIAKACVADINRRINSLQGAVNVSFNPSGDSWVNEDGARRMPPDWEIGKCPIEYNLARRLPSEYDIAVEWKYLFDLWPFIPTWQARVFNRAIKEVGMSVPQGCWLTVTYMDVRGCEGPIIKGPKV